MTGPSIRYSRLNRLKQAKATLSRSQMRRTVRSSGIEANPCRTGCGTPLCVYTQGGVVHHGRITARGGADVVHLRPEGAVPELGVAGQAIGLGVVAEQHGAVTVGIVRHGARGSGSGPKLVRCVHRNLGMALLRETQCSSGGCRSRIATASALLFFHPERVVEENLDSLTVRSHIGLAGPTGITNESNQTRFPASRRVNHADTGQTNPRNDPSRRIEDWL